MTDRVKLAVYFFLVTSTFGFLQPFLPLYMEASGLDKTQIGLASGLGSALALIIQPLLGRWTDRLDTRRPFILGSALLAWGVYSSLPWAQGFFPILAIVAIGANGHMFLNAAAAVLVSRSSAPGEAGSAYAGLRLWGSVGYIATSVLSGILVLYTASDRLDRTGLNPLFWLGSLLFLAIAFLAWTLPDPRASEPRGAPGAAVAGGPSLPANLGWFLGAYFLYGLALYGASSFLSLYLKTLGAKGLAITLTFAAGVVVEVLVMRWSGRFSDRFGRRPVLALSFLLLPLRLLLYIPAMSPWWVAGVQSLHGINFGIMGALAVVFVNDLSLDATRGAAQARLAAMGGLGLALGPPVFGWVSQQWSLGAMFAVAALLAAVAAGIFLAKVQESRPGDERLEDHAPGWLKGMARWLQGPATVPPG